ncbi:MAG: caspase family protein [Planctomycetota bacterium]|nr:caspase family protein [Planctomycetota bacterium]
MPIIVLGLMWVSFVSYQPVSESKVAILIGCNKYSDRTLGDLQYAENDILTLELELKAAGYKTYVMIGSKVRSDVESNGASKVLELIKKTCGSGSVKRENIIVAFSGHGIQKMNNENMQRQELPSIV